MFGKKKTTEKRQSSAGRGQALMQQMGLAIPDSGDLTATPSNNFNENDDEDLEAELAALAGEQVKESKSQKKAKRSVPKSISEKELQKIISNVDEPIDLEVSDSDDPEIEDELEMLAMEASGPSSPKRSPEKIPDATMNPLNSGPTIVQVIEERLVMYRTAQQNARTAHDQSKARRMDRGIKTLQEQLKRAKSGNMISNEDIPPAVTVSTSNHNLAASAQSQSQAQPKPEPVKIYNEERESPRQTEPKPVAVAPPSLPVQQNDSARVVKERGLLYKQAALKAKERGDLETARKYLSTSKQFDTVLEAMMKGEAVDLSKMPPPPPTTSSDQQEPQIDLDPQAEEEAKKLLGVPEAPRNILQALQQRKEKYASELAKAEEAKNNSKSRRFKRIVKQYEEAIKAHKTGRQVDFEELPCPPGFPAIPMQTNEPVQPVVSNVKPLSPLPLPTPKPVEQKVVKKAAPLPPKSGTNLSRAAQQRQILQRRQMEYKYAAAEAKKKGDLESAKDSLRVYLGLKNMVEASEKGLPVDMSNLPPPPLKQSEPQCFIDEPEGDREEVYKKLEQDLIDQIRMCETNHEHFLKLGDINMSNKLDEWAKCARKDLGALKNAFQHNDPPPRSCADLGDNDMELHVVKGINLSLPDGYSPHQLNTYLKYEFPIPKDEPQTGELGSTVKGTNNPEYDFSTKLNIQRKSSAFQRQIKHKNLKVDVYYKRGFMKSDKLLGSVSIKLIDLESHCELHGMHDLYEGRKAVGGKLEVKVRIRTPLSGKSQIEHVNQRWLVLDTFAQAHSIAMNTSNYAQGQK
ncbi:DgyrCDS11244 [Dimorphilus gyrociliatus]|uniref:DgyrCDS11244 n=1 Tax=Dimorphilus gyrociliatus TaxID=2664684 RepID=A0A7I8W2W0_9ANNE|nr:DgyrCDS11244 [Dimorphilus gyrociliatus]